MAKKTISRREFLRGAALCSAALLTGKSWFREGSLRGIRGRGVSASAFEPDAEIALTARETETQILPGAKTRVWGYEGEITSGSGVDLNAIPGSYLGPLIRARRGTKIRLRLTNRLQEETVLHPHGLLVPEEADGTPMQSIAPGQTRVVEFPVLNRACPAWFHPHPMMHTPFQVMMGMAGLFYVTDEQEEQAVPGASNGQNDIPVVIQDRNFDRNNQFWYAPNMMYGYLANQVLVNGKINAGVTVKPRAYRLRLLNGSNARTYKLGWSNGLPLQVIGTDGGLLPAPLEKPYVMLMPGERLDIWADFSASAGQQLTLRSLEFSVMGMMGAMTGRGASMTSSAGMRGGMGMMGNLGIPMDILSVRVEPGAASQPRLGPLPPLEETFNAGNVGNYHTPNRFTLAMAHMMSWTINGRLYQETAVAPEEYVPLDKPIAWEFVNTSPIPHPMHIHSVLFQVVERQGPGSGTYYDSIRQGFVDTGWKDTVSVWPGERVKIAMRFAPYTGMYMYHCHILEHEDMGMMRNLMVMGSTM